MQASLKIAALLSLFAQSCVAQNPVEVYQRWLMIIKPNAQAGGPWVGQLNQADIDAASEAFRNTFPRMVRELSEGRVMIEGQVVVSDSPVTAVNPQALGMVGPEHIPDDVNAHVSPDQWDGVAVYNAFTEHAYWGSSDGAGVGWFSVNHRQDKGMYEDAVSGWVHEMLHTHAWYHADNRLGPVSPSCADAPDGRDGTHCGGNYGYNADSNGLPFWCGWYKDMINGAVADGLGLGSKAWALGSRREAFLGLPPGTFIPAGERAMSASSFEYEPTTTNNTGMDTKIWS